MLKKMKCLKLTPLVCLLVSSQVIAKDLEPKATELVLDGVTTAVFFNDGDTFKILSGEHKDGRVRVGGLNAPESYGPVHQWHKNSRDYLYQIAKEATDMARQGSWNCRLENEKDAYGRLLATCNDLAKALIESGLAHAYSVDESPAQRTYILQQKKAQKERLGMWKGGVPEYIITSLHSISEGSAKPYNRLISGSDGHTKKMFHKEAYASCQNVCLDGDNSCMVYVPFESRYGKNRPDCLLSE